jgi:nucleotide-binding universal stress UspA family protein
MYPHILLAADGSENSFRAAKEAAKLAKLSEHTKITLLFVIDFEKVKTDVLHANSAESLYMERKKKLQAIEQLFTTEQVFYSIEMIHGNPGSEIVKYANSNNVDLVIIGSRGLNSLQEMVLGSVSHKVMKRVQCPAMIVK